MREKHSTRLQKRRRQYSKLCKTIASEKGKGSLTHFLRAVSKWTLKSGKKLKAVSKEAAEAAQRPCTEHAGHALSRQLGDLFLHPGWNSGEKLLDVRCCGLSARLLYMLRVPF